MLSAQNMIRCYRTEWLPESLKVLLSFRVLFLFYHFLPLMIRNLW